jgi:hypothetical protein
MRRLYEIYECDGGDFIGTEDEAVAHVLSVSTNKDGTLKATPDVVCWGAMRVGSPVWMDFHFKGIHPMKLVMEMVVDAAKSTGQSLTEKPS